MAVTMESNEHTTPILLVPEVISAPSDGGN
jgi:hypothetical protein